MNTVKTMNAGEIAPEKILRLQHADFGLEAFVVVDNVVCGPAVGGIRMVSDISLTEVIRLARAMTYKNAAAGLPHGGGKAGIVADPNMSRDVKERLIRAFSRQIRTFTDYIPGPDMGTDETCMAWIHDEIGRAVGLPQVLGGIPLDEIGATGLGIAVAAEVAAPEAGVELVGARVAIQGFGAVGKHAARFLVQRGVQVVAVSDSTGMIYKSEGLDIEALICHKQAEGAVASFADGEPLERDTLIGVDCDIWIPAARPDVLCDHNIARLKAKLVLQGANIPATESAERWMHKHGILSVPDFIANAGGVICAAIEYRGGRQDQALATIEDKIRANTAEMLELASKGDTLPREAGLQMAMSRLDEAKRYRMR